MSIASVVIPAHNEERVIARNLAILHAGVAPGSLDVTVVCNGCTDDTAAAARAAFPDLRVLEIAEASKAAAVLVGNAASDVYPRVHLDADVLLTGSDLLALIDPLLHEGLLATGPRRILDHRRASWAVRSYYAVWEQLPQVRSGLFGRGVVALSREGQARVSALPRVMSDDLAMSEAFEPGERRVVETATVTVIPPASLRDLVRRRVRVATGNSQAAALGLRRDGSATSMTGLLRLVLGRPALAARVPVFVGVALVARARSRRAVRRGDFTTWLRDESSRA